MKKIFKYLGYYNDIDAVGMANYSADEIVECWRDGDSAFHEADEECISDEGDIEDKCYQYTTDGKYVVVYDVADCKVEHAEELESGDAEDEFIDIYEVREEEEDEPDYSSMPTSDLLQHVLETVSKEVIIEMASGYIGEDCEREFLLACLGQDIE